jgi:hypothetical protein
MPAWFPELKDVVLFALSLWGAVLSTITWRKNAGRDRRSVSVQALPAFADDYPDGRTGPSFVLIQATNIGHRDVTITNMGFELPDKRWLLVMDMNNIPGHINTQLPATLKDGQIASVGYLFQDLGSDLRRGGSDKTSLRPFCLDSIGAVHRGQSMPVSAIDLLA